MEPYVKDISIKKTLLFSHAALLQLLRVILSTSKWSVIDYKILFVETYHVHVTEWCVQC